MHQIYFFDDLTQWFVNTDSGVRFKQNADQIYQNSEASVGAQA